MGVFILRPFHFTPKLYSESIDGENIDKTKTCGLVDSHTWIMVTGGRASIGVVS
jgi:hypothetical protein